MRWPKHDSFPSSVISSSLIWKSWQKANSLCSLKCHHAGMQWHLMEDVWSCLWPVLNDFPSKLRRCFHATATLHSAKEFPACARLLLDTNTKVYVQYLSPELSLSSLITAWAAIFPPVFCFMRQSWTNPTQNTCKIVCAFKRKIKVVIECDEGKKSGWKEWLMKCRHRETSAVSSPRKI